MTTPKPDARDRHILLIEDSLSDIRLTQKVFQHARIANQLDVIQDGDQAIDYLLHKGLHAQVNPPDLILLDINLPGVSGHEVLKVIKEHKQLRMIPVIILTASGNEDDVRRAYQAHANAYIRKPVQFEAFIDTMQRIVNFWLGTVRLSIRGDSPAAVH